VSKADTPQPAPTGKGIVVLNEVLARLHDYKHILEAGSTIPNLRGLDRLVDDLEARAEFGKGKYGVYLQTNNGRDAIIDLYQELLDAVMYSAQASLEGDGLDFYLKSVALAEQVALYLEDRDGKVEKCNPSDRN
jgi:hypothetical protein